ncbi:MAG TPA: ABC transporter permease [Acidimicrobiia bacterium]|nr:ABC transporter permease [Acidimicrobiia bacterium]
MATIAAPLDVTTATERAALPLTRVARDIGLVAGRNLRKTIRNTGLIVFSTLQPLMQLVLFVEVFGAVIGTKAGVPYKDFVVPAVLVQTMTFSSMGSGVGIANDLQTGMIDRFRSLPIARSAFLVGRTMSDSLRLGIQALLLVAMSFVLGFSFHNGFAAAVAMVVVIVLFGLALATFSAWVGLTVGDPETVQAAVFVPLLPLVFTSSAFAPISSLPGWMQPIARVSPITAAIDFARGLALGDRTLQRVSDIHLSTAAWHFGLWWAAIVVVFTTLAVRRYRKG